MTYGGWKLVAVSWAIGGCAAAPNAVVGAVAATSAAVAASGVSRATGGCYAACPPGTYCDAVSGLCLSADCGRCADDEVCDTSVLPPQCVSRTLVVGPLTPPEDPSRFGVPDGTPSPPMIGPSLSRTRPPAVGLPPVEVPLGEGTTTSTATAPTVTAEEE